MGMLVRERDASEEASLSGVHVPVVGMVAPAMADDDTGGFQSMAGMSGWAYGGWKW